MSMTIPNSVSAQRASVSGAEAATENSKKTDLQSLREDQKKQLNVSIAKASLTVSTQSQNEPLALIFKSVVDKLNKVLEPEMGEEAIQQATSQDNSPEGTAARIVSLATGFFSAYQQNHEGESESDVLSNFMDLIKGGIDQGFDGAKGILKKLDVLEGDVASNIDKTYALVQKGLDDFVAAQGQADAES